VSFIIAVQQCLEEVRDTCPFVAQTSGADGSHSRHKLKGNKVALWEQHNCSFFFSFFVVFPSVLKQSLAHSKWNNDIRLGAGLEYRCDNEKNINWRVRATSLQYYWIAENSKI
jgi:hypothetical protein